MRTMATDVSAFIERFQLIYEKDPKSKVFAPLAEAYRRMGLIDEAIDLARKGVEQHPHFASGRVALGRCFVQKAQFDEAAKQLKIASDLSPENLLAHQLLAECYSRLNKPIEALNTFKIVLFLNPNDARVAQIVKTLEEKIYAGRTMAGFGESSSDVEEDYAMAPLEEARLKTKERDSDDLERELALVDVRYQNGDFSGVQEILKDLELKYPNNSEVQKRKGYYDRLFKEPTPENYLSPMKGPSPHLHKTEKLKALLSRLEDRRKYSRA